MVVEDRPIYEGLVEILFVDLQQDQTCPGSPMFFQPRSLVWYGPASGSGRHDFDVLPALSENALELGPIGKAADKRRRYCRRLSSSIP